MEYPLSRARPTRGGPTTVTTEGHKIVLEIIRRSVFGAASGRFNVSRKGPWGQIRALEKPKRMPRGAT